MTGYSPKAVRKRLPKGLTDKQERIMVCAVRNPDATPKQIDKKAGAKGAHLVANTLRSVLLGVAGDRDRTDAQNQVEERREGKRMAREYGELTDKQQAIIDLAATRPEFVEDHTNPEIAQAVLEVTGESVSGPHVSKTLNQYAGILARRQAEVSAEDEGDLEAATSDMTVREILETAGYGLPDENLDTMPEDTSTGQVTLAEAEEQDAEDAFTTAAEVDESGGEAEEAEENVQAPARLSREWRQQHLGHVAGSGVANTLPKDAEDDHAKQNTPYWAYVNGVKSFGLFVSLTNPVHGDDVSGLVPKERLAGTPAEYGPGDPLVVELVQRNARGMKFAHYAHTHDVPAGGADTTADDAEAQEGEAEAEGVEGGDTPEEPEGQPSAELEAMDSRVQQHLEQMEVLASRLDSMEEAVDTLRGDTVLASEMRAFAEKVEDRMDELQDAVDSVESGPDGIMEEALDTVEADLQRIQERLDALEERADTEGEAGGSAPDLPALLGHAQTDLRQLAEGGFKVEDYSYTVDGGQARIELTASVPGHETEANDSE